MFKYFTKKRERKDLGIRYLFLKEKIHFKYDLATCQEEIHSFIFERVNTEVRS